MNRVDQSDEFRASGRSLVTDHPAHRPPVSPEHQAREDEIDALLEAARPDDVEVVCLLSRLTSGLGVQALWAPENGTTHVTVTLNGETETFEVPPALLREAFDHPFAYGATLPL
jgi:hypothetical protein